MSFGPGAVKTAVTSGAGMQTVVAAGVLAHQLVRLGGASALHQTYIIRVVRSITEAALVRSSANVARAARSLTISC